MKIAAAARIFASHYQIVVCDDVSAFTEETNWRDGDIEKGFAGNERFRMVGTEADMNDHWVEVLIADSPPDFDPWQRVICVGLKCISGRVHVMSVIDDDPQISLDLPEGEYSVFVAGCNLGIDQNSLGEEGDLTDEQLAKRKDLEWYRIFLVPGNPEKMGKLKDT